MTWVGCIYRGTPGANVLFYPQPFKTSVSSLPAGLDGIVSSSKVPGAALLNRSSPVPTENSVRSETAEVTSIHEILVGSR